MALQALAGAEPSLSQQFGIGPAQQPAEILNHNWCSPWVPALQGRAWLNACVSSHPHDQGQFGSLKSGSTRVSASCGRSNTQVSNLVQGKNTEGRGHDSVIFKASNEMLSVSPARGVKCMVFFIDPNSAFPPFLCSLAGHVQPQDKDMKAQPFVPSDSSTQPPSVPRVPLQPDPSIVLQPCLQGSGLALHI